MLEKLKLKIVGYAWKVKFCSKHIHMYYCISIDRKYTGLLKVIYPNCLVIVWKSFLNLWKCKQIVSTIQLTSHSYNTVSYDYVCQKSTSHCNISNSNSNAKAMHVLVLFFGTLEWSSESWSGNLSVKTVLSAFVMITDVVLMCTHSYCAFPWLRNCPLIVEVLIV